MSNPSIEFLLNFAPLILFSSGLKTKLRAEEKSALSKMVRSNWQFKSVEFEKSADSKLVSTKSTDSKLQFRNLVFFNGSLKKLLCDKLQEEK